MVACRSEEPRNVLGYFKKLPSPSVKFEILEMIGESSRGWILRLVPLTLLGHHSRLNGMTYLERQLYPNPMRERARPGDGSDRESIHRRECAVERLDGS